MPTENRRVATYLPKEIDDRLKAFISERNLKGDSPALIVILCEYFGIETHVAQKVDYSSFVRLEQFNELVSKVSDLSTALEKSNSSSTLLSKLPEKVKILDERVKSLELVNSQSIVKENKLPSQQIDLLTLEPQKEDEPSVSNSSSKNDLPSNFSGELLKSDFGSESENDIPGDLLTDAAEIDISDIENNLSSELKPMTGRALAERFGLYKDSVAGSKRSRSSEEFLEWTKKQDPDGIPWRYDPKDKLYHPIINSSPMSFSSSPI